MLGNVTWQVSGWGRNPTSQWEPGEIYVDEYELLIDKLIDVTSPLLAHLYVGFIDPNTQPVDNLPLSALDSGGAGVNPLLGDIVIRPHRNPDLDDYQFAPVDVQFADSIRLEGVSAPSDVRAGETFTVTMQWRANGAPAADYTAFLHLLDANGDFVTGHDEPPAQGRLPTRYWLDSDMVIGPFGLTVPEGVADRRISLLAGLYESDSQGLTRSPMLEQAARYNG